MTRPEKRRIPRSDRPPLVARSASDGFLTGMAYKGTAEQRRAARQKGLDDAARAKRLEVRPAEYDYIERPWLSRPCPTCAAGVGQPCHMTLGSARLELRRCHSARKAGRK